MDDADCSIGVEQIAYLVGRAKGDATDIFGFFATAQNA
jgi:hypothetical protein